MNQVREKVRDAVEVDEVELWEMGRRARDADEGFVMKAVEEER